jgi:hypothetical protein
MVQKRRSSVNSKNSVKEVIEYLEKRIKIIEGKTEMIKEGKVLVNSKYLDNLIKETINYWQDKFIVAPLDQFAIHQIQRDIKFLIKRTLTELSRDIENDKH